MLVFWDNHLNTDSCSMRGIVARRSAVPAGCRIVCALFVSFRKPVSVRGSGCIAT
jgi:hypothetical protein